MATSAVELNGVTTGAPFGAPARVSRRTGTEWIRDARHLPDSLLHAKRRRAAQLELRNTTPRSIMFVCHGNICRSPFAAAAFLRSVPRHIVESLSVTSAGFIGPDRAPPSKALAASARFGVDISRHRSAVVTTSSLNAADLIVVMSAEQAHGVRARVRSSSVRVLVLGDLDPLPITRRTILDPWAGTDADFTASYDRIERCVRELTRLLHVALDD